jgi:hypothetical protein
MAIFQGPNNPSSGLVFEIDAGNPKSYPGSGSQWFDLASKIVMTSAGTQTPFTTTDGVPCFQFNGSGYWTSTNEEGQRFWTGGGATLELICYRSGDSNTERDTIFEKVATQGGTSYQNEFACTWETAENLSHYRGGATGGSYDYSQTNTTWQDGAWTQWTSTLPGPTPSAGQNRFNGKNVGTYTLRSNGGTNTYRQAGAVRVGTGYAGTMKGNSTTGPFITIARIYNRVLTVDEIKQNWERFKARYGFPAGDNSYGF